MKNFTICSALALIPAALVAQAPVQVPAQPTFTQTLRAGAPEVEKLMSEFKSRDAALRAEGILPATVPAWDKSSPQAQLTSFNSYREYVYAFFLAARAADAAGNWERALELFTKARDTSKTNADSAKESFPLIVSYYNDLAAGGRRTLEENADFIKTLREKANPDEGDKQQLDLIKGEEESIGKNKKSAQIFVDYIESAKKEADYYGKFATEEDAGIKDQLDQLDKYKFKNDKAKFVEGIMSSKTFLDQQFPEKTEKVRYLYRLNVLDPSNRKVVKEIEQLTGVSVGLPAAEEKPTPKGKKAK